MVAPRRTQPSAEDLDEIRTRLEELEKNAPPTDKWKEDLVLMLESMDKRMDRFEYESPPRTNRRAELLAVSTQIAVALAPGIDRSEEAEAHMFTSYAVELADLLIAQVDRKVTERREIISASKIPGRRQ